MSDDFMDLLGPAILARRDPIPTVFGSEAIINAEFQMPAAKALQFSLDQPEHPQAKSQLEVQRLTSNKIRGNFMMLLQQQDANMTEALDAVRANNPKLYLELLIDIAQFITPKLKATKVIIDDETKRNDSMALF